MMEGISCETVSAQYPSPRHQKRLILTLTSTNIANEPSNQDQGDHISGRARAAFTSGRNGMHLEFSHHYLHIGTLPPKTWGCGVKIKNSFLHSGPLDQYRNAANGKGSSCPGFLMF
jgi:hypothetical protein